MARLWSFIRDERGLSLTDWSTDQDVEQHQDALRAGERVLEARLAESRENRRGAYTEAAVRDLANLLADYRAICNRRPRERMAVRRAI